MFMPPSHGLSAFSRDLTATLRDFPFWNILEIYIDLWEEMPNTFGETVGKVGEASLEVDK